MSDRDAFLAAIRAAPDDDAPRLVFADWLEENGDPELAELIRVQCESAALERTPDTDEAEYQRAVVWAYPIRAVPSHFPPDVHRLADLARREAEVLRDNWDRWLDALGRVEDEDSSHLQVRFRRGLPEEVGIATSTFLDAADAVREACPTLRRLALYGPRDRVPDVAALPELAGVPELELADWLTPFDARFLAASLAVQDVRSLTLWLGSRHDADVLRTLATRPGPDDRDWPRDGVLVHGPHLANLRELVLVQLHGGVLAGDRTGALDARADALAAEFNGILGRPVARVVRPFARRFPLDGRVGDNLFAGRFPDFGPALVRGGRRSAVRLFDGDGKVIDDTVLDLNQALMHRPGPPQWADSERELLQALRWELGFETGPIFVREFMSVRSDLGVYLWPAYEDLLADPESGTDGGDREEACAFLDGWMKAENFVVHSLVDHDAGPDGKIHSS